MINRGTGSLALRSLAGMLAFGFLVGVVGVGCSRRHIASRYGVAVKLAAERQAAHPNQFVAERPNGLEPGDTNLVLDNYYATLKTTRGTATTTGSVGNALTGAGVGTVQVQGAQGQ
jgi:hypothetical protein